MSTANSALTGFSASSHPVILVHGWNGEAKSMLPVAAALKSALPVSPYLFDYQSHNTSWASSPDIASCLATYINAASAGFRRAGGDGKVIVVTHSMGGLATRFASSDRYAALPSVSALGGVVTIDTPHLGSPFGNQALARGAEVVLGRHPTSLRHQPKPGTDASICLAAHEPPANKLPHGCALPPYLPVDVPTTQLAGDVTVRRTLFGVQLYAVPLASDGLVPVVSSHGYLQSGPGARPPRGSRTELPTVSCTVDFDQVVHVAAAQGFISGRAKGAGAALLNFLSPNLFTDAQALTQLESGELRSELMAFLFAAELLAPCSHSGMLTDRRSLAEVVAAVRRYLAKFTLATSGGSSPAPLPGLLVEGNGTKFEVRPAIVGYTGDGTGYLGGSDGSPGKGPRNFGHLTWRTWTTAAADAVGVVWLDDCDPDCAHGTYSPHPVTVHADHPKNGHFTEILIRYQYRGRDFADHRKLRVVPGAGFYEWTIAPDSTRP